MKTSRLAVGLAAAIMVLGVGCAKKKVATTTPTPPATTTTTARTAETNTVATPTRTPSNTNNTGTTTNTNNQRVPDAPTRARIDVLLGKIEDAYFDYDRHTLRSDAMQALQNDSKELRDIIVQYPDYKLTIEGHCDERGSEEYNIALGDARAKSAKDYLVGVGIPGNQLAILSYGKDRPACMDHNESCWQKNRRIHIVAASKSAQ